MITVEFTPKELDWLISEIQYTFELMENSKNSEIKRQHRLFHANKNLASNGIVGALKKIEHYEKELNLIKPLLEKLKKI